MEKENENFMKTLNDVVDKLGQKDVVNSNPDYFKNLRKEQLHVSECFSCPLKVQKRRCDDGSKKEVRPNANFDIGNAVESFLYYGLRFLSEEDKWNWKRHYPCSVSISPPLGAVFGSIDIAFKRGNIIIPIEVKTTKARDLEQYCENAHVKGQILSYMLGIGAPTGILRVYSKVTDEVKTKMVDINEFIYIKKQPYLIWKWLKFYWKIWMSEEFTGFTPINDWECQYCEFYPKRCPMWD